MPAISKAQRTAMAIAEHNPSQLNAANRGLLKISKSQLHDFAATPETGLPKKKGSLKAAMRAKSK
jgi:hypothetical protein